MSDGRQVWTVLQKQRERFGLRGILLRTIAVIIALFLAYLGFLWITLPDVSDPRSLVASQSTVIVDRTDTELYRLFEDEDRTYIEGGLIPLHAKQALVAIEDERFYQHGCVDLRAIARAAFANIFGQFKSQGASTLTQQLTRNALLTREKRFTRKFREIMLACKLERLYSKGQILELYLNWIPFGQNAYGIEQASKRYFGISAKDLSPAQSAVLAALPQRPSYFNPYGPHVRTQVSEEVRQKIEERAITAAAQIPEEEIQIGLLGNTIGTGVTALRLGGRVEQVLRKMQDLTFITEAQRLQALEELETLTFTPARENIRAPHFVLWIRKQVAEMFEDSAEQGLLDHGGLQIKTTLDWELQQAAEAAVAFHQEDMRKRFNAHNISLVALHPETREILAYIGNADFTDEEHGGKVDVVLAPRQPGSSFKPFVYATAFQQEYGPTTILYDVETKFGDDTPQNFDGQFWGLMNMRRALGASRNIPAVKAFFLAGGEDAILKNAARFGVTTPLERKQELLAERGTFDYGWPLALGAAETPLLEMVEGYSTFADSGEWKPVRSIQRITDKNGAVLYEAEPIDVSEQVLDPRIAYLLTSILSDVSARPNEYWQTVLTVPGFQTAAKTGTSNKCIERMSTKTGATRTGTPSCKERKPDNLWTIGYTPNLVAGVWVGNASGEPLFEKAESLTTAAPIWRDFMIKAHKRIENPTVSFSIPEGIVQPQISLLSGELPTECTPIELRKADLFLEEKPPTREDPACVQLLVDKVTGLLASDDCPKEAQEMQSFLIPRSILAERWPTWEEGVQKWSKKQMELWKATPTHSGSLLSLPAAPTEKCDPTLTPGRLVKPTLSILYPDDGGTATYPSFQAKLKFKVGSSVREITYALDGKKLVTAGSGDTLEPVLRVPRSIEEEGSHTLTVTLVDQYFNSVSDEVTFRFGRDKNPPQVRITIPREGAVFREGQKLTIRAEAGDDEGGIKHIQFLLDDLLLTTKPQEPYELTYVLKAMNAGPHTIRAKATDLAGNTAEDRVTITVE